MRGATKTNCQKKFYNALLHLECEIRLPPLNRKYHFLVNFSSIYQMWWKLLITA